MLFLLLGCCSVTMHDASFRPMQSSILYVLSTCRNELEIPAELKQSLLVESKLEAAKEEPIALTVKEHLQSLTPEESVQEVSITDEVTALMKKVKADPPAFDLRVKDGSYTVTNYVDEDAIAKKEDETGDHPRRATQKIQTVQNQNPFYMLVACLFRCVKNKGNLKQQTVEKVIMDGVNLVFEPGKMYLVL
jgi:hypothetical protein